jgi:hypothetical protein
VRQLERVMLWFDRREGTELSVLGSAPCEPLLHGNTAVDRIVYSGSSLKDRSVQLADRLRRQTPFATVKRGASLGVPGCFSVPKRLATGSKSLGDTR